MAKIKNNSMKFLTVILILLITGGVFGQNSSHIHRYKFYDTTKVEDLQKVKRRRLTVDVDSASVALYAWGDECYFKVNLLDQMLINANFYETGDRNGQPYLLYGNDNYRFRMYVNNGGNFEFDAIITNRSSPERYQIPFDIQTQGLRFAYQDSIILTYDTNAFTPDSVLNSYAVYHSTARNNVVHITGLDTSYTYYGTGKAFHIYRPKVWDNAGDTIWGEINIDTVLNRMTIGADSLWMANAVYPVTIDPTIGYTTVGASAIQMGSTLRYRRITMPENGTLTDIHSYTSSFASHYMYSGLYDQDLGAVSDSLETETTGYIPGDWGTGAWHMIDMTETLSLSNGTPYWIAIVSSGGTGDTRIYADYIEWHYSEAKLESGTSFPATASESWSDYDWSMYITYTVSGAVEPKRKRRRQILEGGY